MMKISSYALTLSLLTHGGSRSRLAAAQSCGMGVISSFTGECNHANFAANLGCDLDVSEDLVAELCEYDAPIQFVEIQGTYQLDRRYFAGGGPLVDGGRWSLDAAAVARFEANAGSAAVIAFPNYAAREDYNVKEGYATADAPHGYPANMNLETSCALQTIMCCFTDDGQAEGFDGFAANGDATTDVCHHDLADSPESNHINKGWSVFPGAENQPHCVGFTWADGDDGLLGNMMYDVSYRNSGLKGYKGGIPGGPMCGCVEHMPVVEEAACRTATSGPVTYSFSYGGHAVVGGASTGDFEGSRVQAVDPSDPSELHEVRCCSEVALTGFVKNAGCDVFAESDVPECYSDKTLAEAEAICAAAGARLCSEEEILGDCTRGTGCQFDNEHVWTLTSYVSASNSADVTYGPCAAGDLKAQYVANQNGDAAKAALIDAHLVGAGGCAAEVENYLNEEQFVRAGSNTRYIFPDSQWSELIVGEGINFLPPDLDPAVADARFRAFIEGGCTDANGDARYCIVRRTCASCDSIPHRDIYYKRLSPLPSADFDLLRLFTDEWVRENNDMNAGDFALYSTYQDALDGTNAWTYCDYGNWDGYGFPRSCGPDGRVYNNWNSYVRRSHGNANHHGFYVELP